jgi:TniQ
VSVAAPDHLFRAGPRRALPRTCRPAPDETTGSYLLRLAAANRVTGPDLISYLTVGTSQSIANVTLAALATASGQPPLVLAYALPELRSHYPGQHAMALRGRTLPAKPNTVRPACRRCTATRTAAGRIDMWYRHEHNVCLRHLLWTGPGAGNPRDQVDLAAHPDIVHAQVRHLRLVRGHGHGIVRTAYCTAREIWETLIYRGWGVPCTVIRDMHLPAWFGHQDWAGDPRDPVHQAAIYPEVITLTGMLVSPRWRPFAMSASAADHDRFRAEFQHRLPPDCRDLANADLQLRATVGGAPAIWWHQPAAETVDQRTPVADMAMAFPSSWR